MYLVGLGIMFIIIIIAGSNYILPIIFGERGFEFNSTFNNPPSFELDTEKDYLAVIKTNKGNITIDLYEDNAPTNVNNFVNLSQINYYVGTKFHRLIPGLLLQGGDRNTLDEDLTNDGQGNPGYILDDEINWDSLNLSEEKRNILTSEGYSSKAGLTSIPLSNMTLAMANGGANTNGSQFFIVLAKSEDSRVNELNGRFTTIGSVIEGQDVLNTITNITVDNPNLKSPRPSEDIIIEEVEIFTR